MLTATLHGFAYADNLCMLYCGNGYDREGLSLSSGPLDSLS